MEIVANPFTRSRAALYVRRSSESSMLRMTVRAVIADADLAVVVGVVLGHALSEDRDEDALVAAGASISTQS